MAPQEWTWGYFPEAGFKILSPVVLKHETREVPVGEHTILYHQYYGGSLTDSALAMTFVIDHYTVPLLGDPIDSLYYKDFFDTTLDQMLVSLKGTLMYKDYLSTPGKESCIWKASFQDGNGVVRGKLMMNGDLYHGIQVFGLMKDKPDVIMHKFIDSFRLTE
jgi:hypothetical protein